MLDVVFFDCGNRQHFPEVVGCAGGLGVTHVRARKNVAAIVYREKWRIL